MTPQIADSRLRDNPNVGFQAAGYPGVFRVPEGGYIVPEITVGTGVFACGLGGANGGTLYMCSCAPHRTSTPRPAPSPVRDQLLSTRVAVPHAGRP